MGTGLLAACTQSKAPRGVFSFHLLSQPHTLDPRQVQGAAGSFLFSQLHLTLYKWQNIKFQAFAQIQNKPNEHRLLAEGAKHCKWKHPLQLECLLQPARWSDGSPITAHDYVRGMQQILCLKSVHAEHLLNIKGVSSILKSQANTSLYIKNKNLEERKMIGMGTEIGTRTDTGARARAKAKARAEARGSVNDIDLNERLGCDLKNLGIYAHDPLTLVFEFDRPDPEFLYKTLSHALSPLKEYPIQGERVHYTKAFKKLNYHTAHKFITSGPYKIKKWIPNKRLYLIKNPYYKTYTQNKNYTSPNKPHKKLKTQGTNVNNIANRTAEPVMVEVVTAESVAADNRATGDAVTNPATTGRRVVGGAAVLSPLIEILFVDDDTAAMNLFEAGRLSLLRRVPVDDLPRWKQHKNFFTVPLERFDYIGFGPKMAKWPQLTRAMALALDYKALQRILAAPEPLGCPSFSADFMQPPRCLKFNLAQAKQLLQQVPANVRQQTYTFVYSKMGGRSVRTSIEWFEHQWKKHLGLRIILKPLEQGMFLQTLKHQSPDIFRKGGALHRPTCLAGLELFRTGAPENYIQLRDRVFDALLDKTALIEVRGAPQLTQNNLKHTNTTNISRRRGHGAGHKHGNEQGRGDLAAGVSKAKLCSQAVEYLLNRGRTIPLGRIHYGMLHSGKFTGWSINSLQQLDLTQLRSL